MEGGAPAVAGLLAATDNFVFDCDGVLYTPEGAVPGATEALASLRAAGKRVFFVTNTASKTRAELQAGLKAKGIEHPLATMDVAAEIGGEWPCAPGPCARSFGRAAAGQTQPALLLCV